MEYRNNSKAARRRRRRRKKILQAVIPVAVAIILIVVIAVVGWKSGLFDSFMYSSKLADLNSYFRATGEDQVTVMVNGEITDDRLLVKDNEVYLKFDDVKANYNDRFYYDEKGNSLLYTNESGTISAVLGDNFYTQNGAGTQAGYTICFTEGETLYVAIDYVKQFANFEYTLCGGSGEPYRIEIKCEWGKKVLADVTEDETAIRISADKKGDILKKLRKGATLQIISSETEEWLKVSSDDLITGFIEKKHLGEKYEQDETPVTDVAELNIPSVSDMSQVVLAWHNVTNADASSYLAEYSSRLADINVISPTWFSLSDNNGTVASIADPEYVNVAHSAGVKVWGLVDNMTYPEITTYDILSDTGKRASVITQLISYAKTLGLDGINVDFESLTEETGEPFIQFIRELVIEAHKNNLVISVDNYVPKEFTNHYHRKEQGVFADYVIIMGYDEHYSGSEEAGSVASLPFVMEGISKTLEEVPSAKVINAVPFYTRLWTEKGAELECQTLPMGQALEALAASGATAEWDEELGQNYAEWGTDDAKSRLWVEDKQSLASKMSVMKANNLAGVAVWQLAYSTDEAWDAIKEAYPVVK